VAVASAAFTVSHAAHGFWKIYKKSTNPDTFTIKITEDDPIFEIVEDWFMKSLPEESQLSVYAHSKVIKKNDDDNRVGRPDLSNENAKVNIGYSFDGAIAQNLMIAGHVVQVCTAIPETYRSRKKDMGGKPNPWDSRSINIICQTIEARNAVLKEIEEQSQHLVKSQPRMYVSSRYGDWNKRQEIQSRSRDSVILKEGQMDRILGYLKNFLSQKDAYLKADIPFRTGVLLYGEPGSGQSSTALAIANELKMNVFIISLTSLMNDESLNDCFSAIPSNSIVILEDIDIVSAVKDRDKEDDQGVTMTGMLNVLDGFQSPPGVITIMTTNRLDVLDKAIIRPGRVDIHEELGCLDDYQLRGLCEYFMDHIPDNLPYITPEDRITSAEVMGVIRRHLPNFEEAGDDVVKFVEQRLLTKIEERSILSNFT
jgi:DNA polymerase III delta prime subunit